jgi:hypothetical protein
VSICGRGRSGTTPALGEQHPKDLPASGGLDYRARPRPSAQPHRGPPDPRLTPTPGCAMLPNTTERTVLVKAEPCIISLQALHRTNRARGLSPHFLRTPRARNLPSSGLLCPSSNLSVLSVPFPAPAPQHLPSAFRGPRPWPFLPIPDPRSSTPGRMGFPPGTFFAGTHGVSSAAPSGRCAPLFTLPRSPPERRPLTSRSALTTMSACKHVFTIGGSHAGCEARGDVDA